jgi:predicted kinase
MIHLIVGNTGSGKTTYANDLKLDTLGVVFSIDQWNNALYFPDKKEGDGLDWFLERIDRIESVIFDIILQLDMIGIDAILDLGLSKFKHREKFRNFAESNFIPVTTHFLDVPKETRKNRVLKRNYERGETYEFDVTSESFDFMESWFEQPSQEELKGSIVIKN